MLWSLLLHHWHWHAGGVDMEKIAVEVETPTGTQPEPANCHVLLGVLLGTHWKCYSENQIQMSKTVKI